jgi:hypothetical protein
VGNKLAAADGDDLSYLEFNLVLGACASAGRWREMQDVAAVLQRRGGVVTADVLTLMIKGAVVGGNYTEAVRTWDIFRQSGLQPTAHTYALLIAGAMNEKKYNDAYGYFNRWGAHAGGRACAGVCACVRVCACARAVLGMPSRPLLLRCS